MAEWKKELKIKKLIRIAYCKCPNDDIISYGHYRICPYCGSNMANHYLDLKIDDFIELKKELKRARIFANV